ncbi:hypothetical protein LB505_002550 [Fusarium chuoi]|nr:hypothetical protein LB505_002550 [Fusarium chuoi]
MWTDADRQDLQQINQAYLSRPELKVPEHSRNEVKDFIKAGKSATPLQYYRARRAILKAQSAVLEEMRSRFFQSFKKSLQYPDSQIDTTARGTGTGTGTGTGISNQPSEQDFASKAKASITTNATIIQCRETYRIRIGS